MLAKRFVKIGIVIAGYVFALLGASAALYVRLLFTDTAAAQAASGMYAFGDEMLFLGMFGFLSLIPTMLAFYFLRPLEKLWRWFAAACLVFAVLGILLTLIGTVIKMAGAYHDPTWAMVSFLGLLHIFGVPLFFVGFVVLAVIAPPGGSRRLMLIAAAVEMCNGLYVFVMLFVFQRFF